ncbi:MAG: hypothetical protein ACRCX2_30710 [Paraclostridium sp.]
MEFIKVLMDFDNVVKFEKSAEFSYGGDRYMCCVSVNPWNADVLFSLYFNRELVISNRVCILGEKILASFGNESFQDKINGDFAFMPSSISSSTGNKLNYKELGRTAFLYFIDYGDI